MKRLPAAALSFIALLAGSGAVAATTPPPEEEKPAPDAPAAPAPPTAADKPGSYALDANGNKVTGDALSKLPPEAKWAMEAKGYNPILGPNGEVLGYDDGNMSYLPGTVGKEYADAAEKAKLGPGVQGPCLPNFPDCHSKEPAQPPPPTETAADAAGMIPAEPGKNHCDQPGPPPPCAPDPKKETPEQVAEREKQEAEKKVNEKIATSTEKGDVNSLAAAFDERNKARQDANKTADADGAQGGGLGTPGTQDAASGPGAGPIGSTGGQNLGQEGRVGGNSGGLKGREVTPDSRALAQSVIDMNNGMANGDLGPGDPNVQSTAQLAQRGLGGRAFDAAKQLFSTLTESLGVAADTPQTDLSDQLATSPIDGAVADRAAIKIVECKKDTLGGTAGGRTSRRVGGC